MKVLILNGSPRNNGNTQIVLHKIKDKIKACHDVEVLNVCKMNLSGCYACDGCKQNGGHCICQDDSDTVIQNIVKADMIIFGTPVYWWGMSSQLKMVLDKFYSQDPQLHNLYKKIGVVAIGANDLEDPQYRLIHEQFGCISKYLGWEIAFSLSFSAYEPGEVCNNQNLDNTIQEAISRI